MKKASSPRRTRPLVNAGLANTPAPGFCRHVHSVFIRLGGKFYRSGIPKNINAIVKFAARWRPRPSSRAGTARFYTPIQQLIRDRESEKAPITQLPFKKKSLSVTRPARFATAPGKRPPYRVCLDSADISITWLHFIPCQAAPPLTFRGVAGLLPRNHFCGCHFPIPRGRTILPIAG
jgi:hypothetical protein